MAEFQVRAATPEDLANVVVLDRATELLPHWPEAEYAAALTQVDGDVQRCIFVARSRGELVGFTVGMTAVAGEDVIAELESVAVAKPARRTGVASALCAEMISWARLRGARQIELEVRSKSLGAIRLYESVGFFVAGRRPNYYRAPEDDATLMRMAI